MADIADLASLDEEVTVFGKTGLSSISKWQFKTTWKELFATAAPYLLQHPNDELMNRTLAKYLCEKSVPLSLQPTFDMATGAILTRDR